MSASKRRYELLQKRLEQFTRMLHELNEGDVRALHQTRVASRRLREILPVLQLKQEIVHRIGGRLKKITTQLGAVRELDVLSGVVAELQGTGRYDPQALRRIAATIGEERKQAREQLAAKLPTRELHRIARKLDKVGHGLRDTKPSRGWHWAVDARVSRRAETLAQAVDAAGSIYLPERLHDVRIALKKFRYALEIAGEAEGVKSLSDFKTLKRAQDALGRLHDLQVLLDRVRQLQPSLASPDVTMWRKIDALMSSLEDECRRLHARFVAQRRDIRAICERVMRRADGAPERRAVAS